MSGLVIDPRPALVAATCAAGVMLVSLGGLRYRRRLRMRARLRDLQVDGRPPVVRLRAARPSLRSLIARLGASLAARWPTLVDGLALRLERAGMSGVVSPQELLGWKAVSLLACTVLGLAAVSRFQGPGLVMLLVCIAVGWFGVDLFLGRQHEVRRRSILRDLPTVMDLLVLSLEAGMGLDRALRTVSAELNSPLSRELERVLADVDLGIGRGEAFERLARRVGLEDLEALSRAIVQTEQLGVGLVGVMQTQAREVRLARRRAAETEALRAPIKMLVPLVVFILPTLFMLLLGPVGLRAGAALSGS